ncbi:MAG: hypothetical protein CVT92_02780 [Bacteroidetes bacterium HGW-Bacteroidetes-1]|jgi:type IX secretion system PorP/SprF family membrane protein|nr:MAG: hypothetical protein CVT92_02780 [Bacteroidetes bacterium HGW-Bacteroidetes-1]
MKHLTRILVLLLLFVFAGMDTWAQQFPISSHYTVNPYALNPAFAGANNRSEFYMNYRKDWSSIAGSPQTYRINGNRKVYNNMYVGGEIMADFADIFYRLKMGLSYTYRVQLATDQYLSFGLAGHFYQSVIRLDQVNADFDDPIFRNLDRLFKSSYNAGFGLVYNRDNLYLGFGMPVMMRTQDAYLNLSEGTFAFERAYDFYAGNRYQLDSRWEVQPAFVLRKTLNQPVIMDFSAMFIYDKQYWLGGLYRNTSLFGLTVGGQLTNRMMLNYTYEIGVGGIHSQSGGTHEITLGFRREKEDARSIRSRTKTKNSANISKQKQQKETKLKKDKITREREKTQRYKKKKTYLRRTRTSTKLPKYAPYENFK